MGTYSLAEAKLNLSYLIDHALRGEEVVMIRNGRPVMCLKPIARRPKRLTPAALKWLKRHRVGKRMPREDAVTAVRGLRARW